MNQQPALDTLIVALAALPAHNNPLTPVYQALGREQTLTLRAIRAHRQLLHDYAGEADDQGSAIHTVIVSCTQIPPTPLTAVPLAF
ncbi:MAG: hypothetical protein L0332_18030 [Chloroflexi bacterium]|nr:hypothetical protein [Chloroflexota bacterium]MCI0728600.1 hypothetical protein [Chloroflexota bacterium]